MSYADIVLDDSPLLYWPMTSGTAVDSSGNGYNGTSVGSPQAESAGPATCHHADGSTSFDADESSPPYFHRSTSPLTGTGNFTAEIWVRPDSDAFTRSGRRYLTIFGQRPVPRNDTNTLGLYVNLTSNTLYGYCAGTSVSTPISALGDRTECWTHLAFRRSGSTLTLKVNGSTAATGTSSGSVTDQHLAVAADHSDVVWPDTVEEWEMWKGRLAHFALYDGALSDARISARVAAGCTQCGAAPSSWHIGSLRFGSTGPGW